MQQQQQRWVRFEHGGETGFGTLEGDTVHEHRGNMFDRPEPTFRHEAVDTYKAHRTAASLLKKGLFPAVSGEPRAA